MSVSHYVVSWIQVVGLLIGLLGFFFLSIGLFGENSHTWIRPMLSSLAVGLPAAIVPLLVTIPGQGRDPVTVALTIAVGLAGGYYLGRKPPRSHLANYIFAAIGAISLIILIALQSTSNWLLAIVGSLVWAAIILFVLEVPDRLSKQVMTAIGVAATLLAFLTQFIPPMLDLLNIPITKP